MIKAAVLGVDVSKSRSPAIHQAAYRALKLEGSYQAISVDSAGFDALVTKLRAEGYRYLNVTIPHKGAAAALATSASRAVKAAGAANSLIFSAGGKTIRAENTDGVGLIAALGDLGVTVAAGRTAVIVGAGGAAAGAVEALTSAGTRVRLLARHPGAAREIKNRLGAKQQARVAVAGWHKPALVAALEGADMLISAVPAAAWESDGARAGLNALPRQTPVLEMAYGMGTPLAAAVRGRAARYADGLGMLVHQAAHTITLALGTAPPLPTLFHAARKVD